MPLSFPPSSFFQEPFKCSFFHQILCHAQTRRKVSFFQSLEINHSFCLVLQDIWLPGLSVCQQYGSEKSVFLSVLSAVPLFLFLCALCMEQEIYPQLSWYGSGDSSFCPDKKSPYGQVAGDGCHTRGHMYPYYRQGYEGMVWNTSLWRPRRLDTCICRWTDLTVNF